MVKQRKGWRLILCAAMLILTSSVCPSEVNDVLDEIDNIGCGTLIKTCDGVETVIMEGVDDLQQNVNDHTRYYRWWDCATLQWMQSDCPATCTVEIRQSP